MVEILLNLFTGFAIGMGVGFGLALALIKKNNQEELDMYWSAGYQTGLRRGKFKHNQKALKDLENYFELTQMPNDKGEVTKNIEWDRGFQAAMALIREQQK